MNPLLKTYIFSFVSPSGSCRLVKICPEDRYDQSRIDYILDQGRDVSEYCKCIAWFDRNSEHHSFDLLEIPIFEFLHDIVSPDRDQLTYNRHEANEFNANDLSEFQSLLGFSEVHSKSVTPMIENRSDVIRCNLDAVQHILRNLGFRKSSIDSVLPTVPEGSDTSSAIKYCCQHLGGSNE
jgi:hypothetical protein